MGLPGNPTSPLPHLPTTSASSSFLALGMAPVPRNVKHDPWALTAVLVAEWGEPASHPFKNLGHLPSGGAPPLELADVSF